MPHAVKKKGARSRLTNSKTPKHCGTPTQKPHPRCRVCDTRMATTIVTRVAFLLTLAFAANLELWHVTAATDQGDVNALTTLAKTWGIGQRLRWTGNDPCKQGWTGVVCDTTNSSVVQLYLDGMGLSGNLPPEIGNLANLNTLELSNNGGLIGSLPKELGRLTQLEILSIQFCGLTGSIPDELGSLKKLTFIGVNGNNLNGSVPASLGYLTNLVWFDVSINMLTGSIPLGSSSSVGLDNLTSLQHFHFNNNSFSGTVPAPLFNLPTLIHMLIDNNLLKGGIPAEVQNSKTLEILRLDANRLFGPIPTLENLTSLTYLNLKGNKLTGPLPNFSTLTKLNFLDVSENNLDPQNVPDWISSLPELATLSLSSCNLIGQIPPSLFNTPMLQEVDLSSNSLNGTLEINGNIPASLHTINLQQNDITGFNLQHTTTINSSVLWLVGNPVCNYTFLNLQNSPVCTYYNDETIYSSTNASCTGACGDGRSLNIKQCRCSFPLSIDLVLVTASFSVISDDVVNHMEFEISQHYKLDMNQVVIENASFTASDRVEMTILIFSLSGDSVPLNTQNDIVHDLRQHGLTLTEGPFLVYGAFDYQAVGSGSALSTGVIVGISIAGLFIAFIVIASILFGFKQKRKADNALISQPFVGWGGGTKEFGEAPQLKGARWFSLAELKSATNNFSEDNEIGEGGYGKVYKAVFPSGEIRAVKRARADSMQGAAEFKNEIELLSRVHHRNLVGLVGFCYEQSEQMLIYEFMTNGTLRDHLMGSRADSCLSWQRRLDIALGSARGLAYLHDHASPPIIHRDVKSANILLNDKFVAKVSDFGMSKLAPDEGEKAVYSLQVKGTLGYLDPEYYSSNQLTDKSDVYSFGVVLLEIMTARPPIERGKFIVREVETALNRGGFPAFKSLLDSELKEYPPVDLETYVLLALRCVNEAGADRPTMNEIVKELEILGAHSYPNSGVHKSDSGSHKMDLINMDEDIQSAKVPLKSSDLPFQYSGAVQLSTIIEPK